MQGQPYLEGDTGSCGIKMLPRVVLIPPPGRGGGGGDGWLGIRAKKSLCSSNGPLTLGSLFKITFFSGGNFWGVLDG